MCVLSKQILVAIVIPPIYLTYMNLCLTQPFSNLTERAMAKAF